MIKNRIIYEDTIDILSSDNIDFTIFNNKTVLITGANGMLPSYMVYTLLQANIEKKLNIKVLALVRNRNKAERIFRDFLFDSHLEFLVQDVVSPINDSLEIDYIIHAASQASPKYYASDPVGTLKANVIGTQNMLEYAKKHKIEGFLLFSSGGVYGAIDDSGKGITENIYGPINPLNISSCYFESKRMAECMSVCYSYQYGIPVKIVRVFHTLGPTINIDDGRAFSDFCKSIITNKDIVLTSDGTNSRVFCYISDAIKAYFLVLIKGKVGEAYNVGGTTNEIKIKDLANLLVNLYPEKKLSVKFNICPPSELQISKMCNPRKHGFPNVEKIRALGWQESKDITETFKRTIEGINFRIQNEKSKS